MKCVVGPFLLASGMGSLCAVGTLTLFTAIWFTLIIYLSGVIPENDYFPPAWFESNIFGVIYRLYCSNVIGYQYLRGLMHARQSLPHSDYRHGVRCLGEVPTLPASFLAGIESDFEFYKRGGAVVDLVNLGKSEMIYNGVVVVPVPILADNYAYLILSFAKKCCAVVDPADPGHLLHMLRVVRVLTKVDFLLTDILTTHKHWDHAGGNVEILNQVRSGNTEYQELVSSQLKIYGSSRDKPHACTNFVEDDDILSVAGDGVKVAVFASPGHTAGSVLFLAGDVAQKPDAPQRLALFTGDCIFCGSCGAMFEVSCVEEVLQTVDLFHGDKLQTHPATKTVVSADDVLVYAGHEYTEHLLEGLITSQRVKEGGAAEGCDVETLAYKKELEDAMRTTRRLRSMCLTDDISSSVCTGKNTGGTRALPACTMPSTLAIERKINSLLKIRRSILEDLRGTRFLQKKLSALITRPTHCRTLE